MNNILRNGVFQVRQTRKICLADVLRSILEMDHMRQKQERYIIQDAIMSITVKMNVINVTG